MERPQLPGNIDLNTGSDPGQLKADQTIDCSVDEFQTFTEAEIKVTWSVLAQHRKDLEAKFKFGHMDLVGQNMAGCQHANIRQELARCLDAPAWLRWLALKICAS